MKTMIALLALAALLSVGTASAEVQTNTSTHQPTEFYCTPAIGFVCQILNYDCNVLTEHFLGRPCPVL